MSFYNKHFAAFNEGFLSFLLRSLKVTVQRGFSTRICGFIGVLNTEKSTPRYQFKQGVQKVPGEQCSTKIVDVLLQRSFKSGGELQNFQKRHRCQLTPHFKRRGEK
jgi:hypothetical protein